MEYTELDHSNRQGYSNENHLNQSYRDWFTGDKTAEADGDCDLMEISPPSDSQYHNQNQQRCGKQQTLGLGIGGQICNIEREHMFDKVVTPSDVGKLNRLVIPKQNAEKYFPLDSSSSDHQKGLLLNFEDITGKTWRFRYSYWSSSQSYVMTKGWSMFVKEKKLDAGDVVSFQRGIGETEKHRLFIDWRKRPISRLPVDTYHTQFYSAGAGFPSWSPLVFRPTHTRVHPSIDFQIPNNQNSHYYSGYSGDNYMSRQVVTDNGSVVYLASPEIGSLRGRASSGGVGERIPVVFLSVPVVHGKKVVAAAKKLRLFGVNMDCPISSDTSTSDEFEMFSSPAIQVNITPTSYLNQYPSSSTRMMYDDTPVSNKDKTSLSLDFNI